MTELEFREKLQLKREYEQEFRDQIAALEAANAALETEYTNLANDHAAYTTKMQAVAVERENALALLIATQRDNAALREQIAALTAERDELAQQAFDLTYSLSVSQEQTKEAESERDAALDSAFAWKASAKMHRANSHQTHTIWKETEAERDNARDDAAALRSKLTDIEIAAQQAGVMGIAFMAAVARDGQNAEETIDIPDKLSQDDYEFYSAKLVTRGPATPEPLTDPFAFDVVVAQQQAAAIKARVTNAAVGEEGE
jgi:chromosome segregation ATPase